MVSFEVFFVGFNVDWELRKPPLEALIMLLPCFDGFDCFFYLINPFKSDAVCVLNCMLVLDLEEHLMQKSMRRPWNVGHDVSDQILHLLVGREGQDKLAAHDDFERHHTNAP